MQQTHRRRHRLIWIVLGPLIIIALIVSVATRPSWPDNEPAPASEGARP